MTLVILANRFGGNLPEGFVDSRDGPPHLLFSESVVYATGDGRVEVLAQFASKCDEPRQFARCEIANQPFCRSWFS
jgi:hypothetical protein